MVGSIREILKIETPEQLRAAFLQLEEDLKEKLDIIESLLEKDILSGDVPSIFNHMTYVESRRSAVGRYLYLVDGFVSYAKSSRFSLPAEKGVITEAVREAYKKTLAGPFEAMQRRLENIIDNIDSRVNMCKKKLGVEFGEEKLRNAKFAA
jgi:hypothetical protein